MENNDIHNEVLAKEEVVVERKKCKCCGKELPINYFKKQGTGYRNICISCAREESGASEKFKNFTSRELMEELRSRGYTGILKRTKIEEIKI